MKKLLNKVRRKKDKVEESARITTETIAEHRERILAGGRRFKYPVQYARHRLVFNAIIIAVAVILLLIGFVYQQLYFAQNTSDFFYRITKVVPVPVASIEGQSVQYSDYLMKYRSSIHYLTEKEQLNLKTEDGKRQSDFVKQQEMKNALTEAYAVKLAKERNISVSSAELETFLKQQRKSSDGEVSEATYNAVILDYYGWSPDEYRHAMESKLLLQKVAYAIDEQAEKTSTAVGKAIEAGSTDFKTLAESTNTSSSLQVVYASPGWVPKANQDGGLAIAASGLQKGQISKAITSTNGDGYYYIKLLDANDTQVNYEYIHVPLTAFAQKVDAALKSDQTKKFISIPEVKTTNE